MSRATPLAEAERALNLVAAAPTEARRVARETHRTALTAHDFDAASVAGRAWGLAEVYLGDLDAAVQHLTSAVRIAMQAQSLALAGEARLSLAFALNRRGNLRRAVTEVSSALDEIDPGHRGQGLAQRAAILQQLGRLDDATNDYRVALPLLRRAGDAVWIQRALCNRGVLHAFRHEYHLALHDLLEAERLCRDHGLTLSMAIVQENLALVHRRLGNVPEALSYLERAEQVYLEEGAPRGSLLLERSEILLSIRLFSEAHQSCESAVAEFERTKQDLSTPEARLLLARVAALDGQAAVAIEQASRAVVEFRRQARDEWTALARCALLLARLEGDAVARPSAREMARAADNADRHGWPSTALETRLRAGLVAVSDGRQRDLGLRLLDDVSTARHRGSADRRVKGWYAASVLRREAGDRRGSKTAARRGLQIIDEYRRTIAATDLRARLSGLGVDLSQLGLRMAVESNDAEQVLGWAELGRSRHLRERPVLPPSDPRVSQLLAELRSAVADLNDPGPSHARNRAQSQVVALERQIRDATRGRPSGEVRTRPSALTSHTLAPALGDAVLVEYVELDGHYTAVCVHDGRATMTRLGSVESVSKLLRWLPLEVQRLPHYEPQSERGARAIHVLASTSEKLADLLVSPLRGSLQDRSVVLVPTGLLQSMPWSLLPGLRGRTVTVVPSAGVWLSASQQPRRPSGTVLAVAGPGLRAADREARDVAALYADGHALVGSASSVGALNRTVAQASVLHFAAHGTVRADNPLFSSLRLADGPLTVYDLERMEFDADTVVMAACESARDVVLAGDETLGLSAAFLARGTRNVVASVIPVPDASTRRLMIDLHREMARHTPVATALALAQARVDPRDPSAYAAAAGFVCLGVGFQPIPA